MLRLAIFCLFIVQILTTGPPPEKCRRPPADVKNPFECCKFPPVFKEEDLKECGIEKPAADEKKRRGPPDCDKQLCLMRKYNLVDDDNNLDKTAIAAFIDQWSSNNPGFTDAVEITKTVCTSGELPGPPEICEANRMAFCITTTMFRNCPVYEESEECQKVKQHNEECKQYFQ